METLVFLALLLVPAIGLVAGFLVGTLRRVPVRIAAALVVIAGPLAYLSMPLLLPGTSPEQRFGASFGLTLFALHLALWMLFAALGVVVGTARRHRPG